MKLWLVRHAAPSIDEGVCYGRTDVPAVAQATADAARALAAVLPEGARIIASPALRCMQLAQALQSLRPGLALEQDERLREMDFGSWEGRRWDEIPRPEIDTWTADFARYPPGGGESVQDLMARVKAALDDTLLVGSEQAWITHAGVIRAAGLLLSGQMQVDSAAQWPSAALPFGSWQVHEATRLSATAAAARA